MSRIPLLSGTRIAVVDVPENGIVLRPPPPTDVVRDVDSATREALRFPLSGPPLASLVTPGGTATVVVEMPNLPVPASTVDPRQEAIAATVGELERLGVAHVTILVAGGLFRRPSPREIGLLVTPEFRRRFRGRLIVHDTEAEDLVEVGTAAGRPLRVAPSLVETDLVVTVTAAETVLHGGPSALLRASSPEVLRGSGATSLLETSSSQGWTLAVELERQVAARTPIYGVSLVLNLPHVFGGYPYEEQILERIARSKLRRGLALLPGPVRGSRDRACAARPDGRRSARRHALGGAHRGAPARDRVQGRDARRAPGRDGDRHPADDAVLAARPPEPGLGRLLRARARAAPLAERVPGEGRGNGDPPPRLRPPLSRPGSDAVPLAVRRHAHGPRPGGAARGRAVGDRRRAGDPASTARAAPSIRSSRSSAGARATRR